MVTDMSGIDGNLKLSTQLAPAPAPQKPAPSEPLSVPSTSIQDVSRDVQAVKGESAKQLSQNFEDVKAAVKALNIAIFVIS